MRKCNYAIDEASQGPVTEEEDPTIGAEETCFFHTSTSKFVALTIVSFGLWQVYWLYRNWRYLRDNGRRGISPFWRSVFDLLWVYDLFNSIKSQPVAMATRVRPYPAGNLAIGYIVAGIASIALYAFEASPWWQLGLSFLNAACMLPVQSFIVRVNTCSVPRRAMSQTGAGLVAVVILGALCGILYLRTACAGE